MLVQKSVNFKLITKYVIKILWHKYNALSEIYFESECIAHARFPIFWLDPRWTPMEGEVI